MWSLPGCGKNVTFSYARLGKKCDLVKYAQNARLWKKCDQKYAQYARLWKKCDLHLLVQALLALLGRKFWWKNKKCQPNVTFFPQSGSHIFSIWHQLITQKNALTRVGAFWERTMSHRLKFRFLQFSMIFHVSFSNIAFNLLVTLFFFALF